LDAIKGYEYDLIMWVKLKCCIGKLADAHELGIGLLHCELFLRRQH